VTKLRLTVSIVVVVAAAIAVSSVASAAGTGERAKIVPFTAKYAGKAVVQVTDTIADISANGVGTATLLGAGKITGTGTGNTAEQPCVPFTGTGTIVGKAGKKLNFTVLPGSTGCGDSEGQVFSIVSRVKVTGGAGKLSTGASLKKARGALKITGVYNRGDGTFSIKINGKLTV
jgi:hypothetical protein